MKRFKLLLLAAFLFFYSLSLFSQHLVFETQYPIPGEKITFEYNPVGTPLERVEKFEAIAYEFTEGEPKATEVYLQLKNSAYVGKIAVSKNAKAIFISFSADFKRDNNKGEGYGVMVYQKDRKSTQSGAFVSMSEAYAKYYRNIGIDRDYEKAFNYLMKAYSENPDLKKEGEHLASYVFYASKIKNEKALEECKSLINTMRLQTDSEEDMSTIKALYSNTGDDESAKGIEEKILAEYPNGALAQRNLVNSFYRTKSLEKKLEIYNILSTQYVDSEVVKPSWDRINGSVAMDYAKAENWEKFEEYLSKIASPRTQASYLNSLAWQFSGESIDAKPKNTAKGLALSKRSLDLMKVSIETLADKPDSRTKNQWKKQLEYSYGMYADTYALCAFHEGNIEDAMKYQSLACEAKKFLDKEMNERYCIYLEKRKGAAATEKELQKLMSLGAASEKMKEQYHRIYLANNTLESALAKNIEFLESMADEKQKEELKKKMLADEAPNFSLVNLKGEKVTLNNLKGKVVVVDFWATWCGPCKASFPGMQTALEKYEKNDEVVFLFIDTWERGENKAENAQKFIDDKGYTFNVLMDDENEVVAKFKVTGIPTKFIIDKKGSIRFVSQGFGGNNDKLVNELTQMIEMANEVSSGNQTTP